MKFQNMLDDSHDTTRHDSSIYSSSHIIFPFTLSVFDCSWTERRGTREGHIHFYHGHLGKAAESKFEIGGVWSVGRRRRLEAMLDSISRLWTVRM